MRNATNIVFRRITGADFFNIYKARGAEVRGGGQSYIDIDTSGVSLANWHEFFEDIVPTEMGGRPAWDFTIHSLGLEGAQTLRISQRRNTSVSIRSQKLLSRRSNRVHAWHPDYTNFPNPVAPPTHANDPAITPLIDRLVIFIVRDDQGDYWAGWFQRAQPDPAWAVDQRLEAMFIKGDGYIDLEDAIPFDESVSDWSFRSGISSQEGNKRGPKSEERITTELFEDDVVNDTAETIEATRRIRVRNQRAVRLLKVLYGTCQITGDTFVFQKPNGQPYTEAHHLIPLGVGGADSPWNLVIVSAHVHRMLHYAEVSEIDLTKMDDRKLKITINGELFTITWHPEHARLVEEAVEGSGDDG